MPGPGEDRTCSAPSALRGSTEIGLRARLLAPRIRGAKPLVDDIPLPLERQATEPAPRRVSCGFSHPMTAFEERASKKPGISGTTVRHPSRLPSGLGENRAARPLPGPARATRAHTISPLSTSFTLLASCFRLKGLGRKWISLSLSRRLRNASSV